MRHLILTAALAAALPAHASPSISDGKALADESCAACHGEHGNSPDDPAIPKLAGQKSGYIARQLRAFRAGTRKSEVMGHSAESLTDSQIADLSAWFAAQRRTPEPAGMKPIGNARLGARLWQARGLGQPPCAACHALQDFQRPGYGGGMGHGPGMGWRGGMGWGGGMGRMGHGPGMGHGMMMGTDPATTPTLYAQHGDYLLAQLNAFADGTRQDPVMGPIARNLSPTERAALAAYLASVR